MRSLRTLRRLARDIRGATIVEFAIITPVMMMIIMGLGDLTYQAYTQSLLDGTLQKAGRDSTIQGSAQNTAAIDKIVKDTVKVIAKNATFESTRKSYSSFSNIKPETFDDANGDGARNPGECFDDINGNKTWDVDPGNSSQGGANDVTLYSMTVTYPRLFPVAGLLGFSPQQKITSRTILKNQPYASQSVVATATVCT